MKMGSLSEDDGSEVEAGFGATEACVPETAAAFEATQPAMTKSWWLRPLGDVAALGARPIRIPDGGAITFGSRRAASGRTSPWRSVVCMMAL